MNGQDKSKIRTATVIFLQQRKRATAKQIQEYIISCRLPFIGEGASNPQAITRVLKDSSKSWHLQYEKDNHGRHVWSLKK